MLAGHPQGLDTVRPAAVVGVGDGDGADLAGVPEDGVRWFVMGFGEVGEGEVRGAVFEH